MKEIILLFILLPSIGFCGEIRFGNNSSVGATVNALTITGTSNGCLAVNVDDLYVDCNQHRVGIDRLTPGSVLDVNGNFQWGSSFVSSGTSTGGLTMQDNISMSSTNPNNNQIQLKDSTSLSWILHKLGRGDLLGIDNNNGGAAPILTLNYTGQVGVGVYTPTNSMLEAQASTGTVKYVIQASSQNGTALMNVDQNGGMFSLGGFTSSSFTVAGSTFGVLNTGVWSAPAQSGARVTGISGPLTIPAGVLQPMFWSGTTKGGFNNQATFNQASSSDTLTARGAGVYRVTCKLSYLSMGTSSAVRLQVTVAGTSFAETKAPTSATAEVHLVISEDMLLANGNAVKCNAYADGGTTVTLDSDVNEVSFSILKGT